MLKLVIISKFSNIEYCQMVLFYAECGRQARAAQRLYRQHFPGGPHPSRQGHRKDSGKSIVTHKNRRGRTRRVGKRVQPEDILTYAITYPQSSTRDISEHCGLQKSRI